MSTAPTLLCCLSPFLRPWAVDKCLHSMMHVRYDAWSTLVWGGGRLWQFLLYLFLYYTVDTRACIGRCYVAINKPSQFLRAAVLCADVCPSVVRLLAGGRRPDPVCAGRRLVSRRRHSAGDQQGWSQLVAGAPLGCTAVRAGRPRAVSGTPGVENGMRCHWEGKARSSRYYLMCFRLSLDCNLSVLYIVSSGDFQPQMILFCNSFHRHL